MRLLIEEEHVAVVPGTAFGHRAARATSACSYATSLAKIEEALHRITRFVGKVSASAPARPAPPAREAVPSR